MCLLSTNGKRTENSCSSYEDKNRQNSNKRTPKTKVRPEDKPRLNAYLCQYFKENQNEQRLRCRQWAQNPRNKETRNVRQRLRRYKVKLNTQLTTIWIQRGLITL